MVDFNPYEDQFSDAELVEMAMGNPVGPNGIKLKEGTVRLTKAQAHIITEAISQFRNYESDTEQEVAHRTERLIREKFELDEDETI